LPDKQFGYSNIVHYWLLKIRH